MKNDLKNNEHTETEDKTKTDAELKAEVKSETGEEIKKETGAETKTETEKRERKRHLMPALIVLALIAVLLLVYGGIALSYQNKFLPGTYINGIDCSRLDAAQVAGILENQLQSYCLEVKGRDYATGQSDSLLGTVTAADIQLSYSDSRGAVEELLRSQNVLTWAYRALSDDIYSKTLSQGVSYDKPQLEALVEGWEACEEKNMLAPQDAFISGYSDSLKGYEIIPETLGTEFDVEKLLELMDTAILAQQEELDIEEAGCYTEAAVTREDAGLKEYVETANRWLSTKITYDWNGTEVMVDAERLKDWITMEKRGPVLDEAAVAAFVREQAENYDTYGKRRNFVTTLGIELSLPSGYYGWLTDTEGETEELLKLIRQGSVVSKEPIYASTAKKKGMSDIGNSYVEADLTHQHLYLYQNGSVVLETDFVSGSMSSTPDCVTPEGVFGLSYKTTNAVLRGANYETPVNYWMPFYGNFGMHDATWRSEFGGQIYITNGSHGCLNLPLDAASQIYQYVSTGFPVICYYYPVDPLADQNVPAEEYDEEDDEEE